MAVRSTSCQAPNKRKLGEGLAASISDSKRSRLQPVPVTPLPIRPSPVFVVSSNGAEVENSASLEIERKKAIQIWWMSVVVNEIKAESDLFLSVQGCARIEAQMLAAFWERPAPCNDMCQVGSCAASLVLD
jgi:hypothetical protein